MKLIIVSLLLLGIGLEARAGNSLLMEQADALHAQFKDLAACPFYEEALKQNPTDAVVLVKLAWACNNAGEDLNSRESEAYYEKAVQYAETLRPLAPTNAETFFLLAMTKGNLALFRGGKQKVALSRTLREDALKSISLDPAYALPHAALGVYYREVATLNWFQRTYAQHLLGGLPEGTLEDSEASLLKSISLDSNSIFAHFQLAETYEAMNQPKKAIGQYQAVLALPIRDHQDTAFRQEATDALKQLQVP